jgi:hypothetical protein
MANGTQHTKGSAYSKADKLRALELLECTAVDTINGDHTAHSLYPGSFVHQHFIKPQRWMDGKTEGKFNHPDGIRVLGISITEEGSHPTNALGIEFGKESGLGPVLVVGLSEAETAKFWKMVSVANEQASAFTPPPDEDEYSEYRALSQKFPPIGRSVQSAITDVERTFIRSPKPASIEESGGTLQSSPTSLPIPLGQTANPASIRSRQTWMTKPE